MQPRRSFDYGSASSFGQTRFPLAFAQDDERFLDLRTFAEVSSCRGHIILISVACIRKPAKLILRQAQEDRKPDFGSVEGLSLMTSSRSIPAPVSKRELYTVFAGLMLALTLASLDQNIVSTALPRIVSDLGGLAHLSWVVTAFMVTSTISTPLYGKLSDMYGRKPLFFTAIIIFLIGSVVCGLAHTMFQLILFRALQGLGAGGLITLAQTTVGDLIVPRERGKYQGLFGAVFAACSVAGPVLGGFITDKLSWRWIFYVNLPVGAAALSLIAIGLRHHCNKVAAPDRLHRRGLSHRRHGQPALCLSWGGSVYPWASPVIIGLAAAVSLFSGLLYPARTTGAGADPAAASLPRSGFHRRGQRHRAQRHGALWQPCFSPAFFSGRARRVRLPSAGLMMSPMMAGVIIASVTGGRLVSRFGRYKIFPIIGLIVGNVQLPRAGLVRVNGATGGLDRDRADRPRRGLGLVMPNLTVAIQNSVERRIWARRLRSRRLSARSAARSAWPWPGRCWRFDFARTSPAS